VPGVHADLVGSAAHSFDQFWRCPVSQVLPCEAPDPSDPSEVVVLHPQAIVVHSHRPEPVFLVMQVFRLCRVFMEVLLESERAPRQVEYRAIDGFSVLLRRRVKNVLAYVVLCPPTGGIGY
jgi:hypothetical protein